MPTLRQQKAIKLISDFIRNPNGKSVNYGELLRKAGYSKSTAEKPHLILSSETFQTMLNEALSDLDLYVQAQHFFLINQSGNLPVKAKAIDMYYKLTGKYQAEKIDVTQDREISEAIEKIGKLLP